MLLIFKINQSPINYTIHLVNCRFFEGMEKFPGRECLIQ